MGRCGRRGGRSGGGRYQKMLQRNGQPRRRSRRVAERETRTTRKCLPEDETVASSSSSAGPSCSSVTCDLPAVASKSLGERNAGRREQNASAEDSPTTSELELCFDFTGEDGQTTFCPNLSDESLGILLNDHPSNTIVDNDWCDNFLASFGDWPVLPDAEEAGVLSTQFVAELLHTPESMITPESGPNSLNLRLPVKGAGKKGQECIPRDNLETVVVVDISGDVSLDLSVVDISEDKSLDSSVVDISGDKSLDSSVVEISEDNSLDSSVVWTSEIRPCSSQTRQPLKRKIQPQKEDRKKIGAVHNVVAELTIFEKDEKGMKRRVFERRGLLVETTGNGKLKIAVAKRRLAKRS